MEDRKSRINKLSELFKNRQGRPKQSSRDLERKSYYLDTQVSERLDQSFKDFNYKEYPHTVNKSLFIESILEYGMDNIDAVKKIIRLKSENGEPEA